MNKLMKNNSIAFTFASAEVNKVGQNFIKLTELFTGKLKLKRFLKRGVFTKEYFLLDDYLLCFHKDFANEKLVRSLKNCKGLNYFLEVQENSNSFFCLYE